MSEKNSSVYALNVNLFAFILKSGQALNSPNLLKKEIEEFKNMYEGILGNFDSKIPNISKDFPKLRQNIPDSDRYDLLNCELEDSRQFFLFSSEENNQVPLDSKLLYNLLLYPQNIGDSYALLINIFRPQAPGLEEVKFEEIYDFNPKQCLTLEPDKFFIGQTLLITVFSHRSKPDKPEELRPDAEELLKKLLTFCPEFYQAENFLNSYILEFSRPKKSLFRYLVLFYFDESTSEQLEKIYFDLPELFLYYHKITHVFQMSRKSADDIDKLIRDEIEAKLPSYSNPSSEQSQPSERLNLEDLKTQLKNLLKTAPKYTLQFRELEYALNTININTGNYQRTLKRLQTQANNPLDFFSRFAERESQTCQLQIQADLNYAKPGSQLLDQAIASIRGLVEIDQAESDRALAQAEKERERNQAKRDRILAQAEKERDRNLQTVIAVVGVGIGVAGVTATALPYYMKPADSPPEIQLFPWNSSAHPITKSISISLAIGLLASVGTLVLIYLGGWLWRLIKPPSLTESPESKQEALPSSSSSETPAPMQQDPKVAETLPTNSDKT